MFDPCIGVEATTVASDATHGHAHGQRIRSRGGTFATRRTWAQLGPNESRELARGALPGLPHGGGARLSSQSFTGPPIWGQGVASSNLASPMKKSG